MNSHMFCLWKHDPCILAFCRALILNFTSLEEVTVKLILIKTRDVFHKVATKVFMSS